MKVRSEKVRFAGAHDEPLDGRLERPDGTPRAWALFAHCFTCTKDISAATRIARALAERGIAVLRFDFTGLGNSDGDFANTNFSSNVDDLVAAAEFLRAKHEAPALLIGHSLGGAAAVSAARRIDGVRGVATIAAPSSADHVKKLLGDAVEQIEAEGRAEVHLAGRRFTITRTFLADLARQRVLEDARALGRAALLILHSPVDNVVGIDHARRLYEAALHPKSFVSLDQADHLLTRKADAGYAAEVIAAWAARYIGDGEEDGGTEGGNEEPAEGEVHVEGRGTEGYLQRVTAGHHRFLADEPEKWGGSDRGPNPYDLLLAALGACTAMTVQGYARRREWPLDAVHVRLRHRKIHAKDCEECESRDGKIDHITRTIEVEGDLDDEQRAELIRIADRCPVHETLGSETRIDTGDSPA